MKNDEALATVELLDDDLTALEIEVMDITDATAMTSLGASSSPHWWCCSSSSSSSCC